MIFLKFQTKKIIGLSRATIKSLQKEDCSVFDGLKTMLLNMNFLNLMKRLMINLNDALITKRQEGAQRYGKLTLLHITNVIEEILKELN